MFLSEKIETLRNDTPGVQHCVHLNNAGAALMPNPVINAIKNHIDLEGKIGGYEAAFAIQSEVEEFYRQTGRLIGTAARNIAFTASATDAYARALSSIKFKPGEIVLTSSNDYASNFIAFLSLKQRYGIEIRILENESSGQVDLQDLSSKLDQLNPRVLAITHVPTNSGLIQPVQEIGAIAKKYNTIYLVDGCQSVGQLTIDVQTMHCDFFSATFRKFLRGPRGAGFLYVSDQILAQPIAPLFVDMRGADWIGEDSFTLRQDAGRFEEWEKPYTLLLGAKSSVEYLIEQGVASVAARTQWLSDRLRSQLAEIPKVEILDRGKHLAALVTFHIAGANPDDIRSFLNTRRINSSLVVLSSAYLDFREKGVEWAIRLSPHYYNTEDEIDRASTAVRSFMDRN